jgi:hypothetical protein
MERLLAIMLLMSLVTVSCNKSGDGSSSQESSTTTTIEGSDTTDTTDTTGSTTETPDTTTDPAPVPTPVPTPTPVPDTTTDTGTDTTPAPSSTLPAQALSFKTNVSYLSGFEASDEAKYNQAAAIVKKVVATEAFRTAVLNFTYNGVKAFVQNNGLTNEQIYQTILDAAEKLTPTKNNTLDVGVKLYYENSSTVGYTSTAYTYINVNTKFFDTYAASSVASNLFHEWLHKLGYSHDAAATARRPYSVPYAVGYIIRDIGKNFL